MAISRTSQYAGPGPEARRKRERIAVDADAAIAAEYKQRRWHAYFVLPSFSHIYNRCGFYLVHKFHRS